MSTAPYILFDLLSKLHEDVVKAFKFSSREVTREFLNHAIIEYLAQPRSYPELRVNSLFFAKGDEDFRLSDWLNEFVVQAENVDWESYSQSAKLKISEIKTLAQSLKN